MPTILPTEFAEFAAGLRGRPYREAIPTALPERWIVPIARDFRLFEQMVRCDSAEEVSLSGPLAVLTHVLMGRMQERGISHPIHCTLNDAARWFKLYQVFVEREMVTRLIGVPADNDESDFIAAIDQEIDRLSEEHT